MTPLAYRCAAALILAPSASAVAGFGGGPSARGEPATSAGPASANTVASDIVLHATWSPRYRIGRVDGGHLETFSDIAAVAFDPMGRLVILDSGADRLVMVGRDGTALRSIGRSGRGPGELSRPVGLAATRQGELIVFDAGSGAFVVYDTAGTYLRQLRPPFGTRYPGTRLRAAWGGGVVSASGDGLSLVDPREGESGSFRLNYYPLVDSADPTPLGDARRLNGGSPAERRAIRNRAVGFSALPALAPRLHFDALPGGRVAYSDSSDYRITVVGNSSAPEVYSRPIKPRATAARDRDAEIERRRRRARESQRGIALGGADMERSLADLEFWPEVPVITGLRTDPAGHIWVGRSDPVGGSSVVDLLDASGRYLGTLVRQHLEVPDALGPDGLLAFVEAGELGEPQVRVVRVDLEIPSPR